MKHQLFVSKTSISMFSVLCPIGDPDSSVTHCHNCNIIDECRHSLIKKDDIFIVLDAHMPGHYHDYVRVFHDGIIGFIVYGDAVKKASEGKTSVILSLLPKSAVDPYARGALDPAQPNESV